MRLAAAALWLAMAPGLALAGGDPARGRALVVDRSAGLCLLCHGGPFPEERQPGNLAPSLAGVGARLGAEQLRRQLLAPRSLNPESLMPSYGPREAADDEAARVAPAWRGRPLLEASQIDDVVAFLLTLK